MDASVYASQLSIVGNVRSGTAFYPAIRAGFAYRQYCLDSLFLSE